MPKRLSTAFIEFIKVWGLLAAIVIVGFVVAYQYVEAPPPKAVRIATGPQNGAYHAFARQYARLLARDGVTLEVVSTAGTVENLELLKKGDVSLALIQGGSVADADKAQLQSLGSLFLEPVWIFARQQKPIKRVADLKGKRVAVGAAGSGTYLLATQLLTATGVSASNATWVSAGASDAPALLGRGEVDAAIFVASALAPLVQSLLSAPSIELLNFDRAAAFGHRFPFLTPVVLSEGVLSLDRNIPPRDITLVAVAANLVARRDLNDSLVPALMEAIVAVHQPGGVLERRRQFPSVDFVDLPMNEDARRYLVNGPSFLFRWLPYGTAVLLDRLKILVLPFIALLIPLFRIAPPLYTWSVRSKIFRWYAGVRELDSLMQQNPSAAEARAARERLKKLESEVASVSVPLSYAGELYHLRLHIGFLQERLERLASGASKEAKADVVEERAG